MSGLTLYYHVSGSTCGASPPPQSWGHRKLWRKPDAPLWPCAFPQSGGTAHLSRARAGCSCPSTAQLGPITEGAWRTDLATERIPSSALNPLRQDGVCVGPKCSASQWGHVGSAEALSQHFKRAGRRRPLHLGWQVPRQLSPSCLTPGRKFLSLSASKTAHRVQRECNFTKPLGRRALRSWGRRTERKSQTLIQL